MGVLHIKEFPNDVRLKMRASAKRLGISLRAYIVGFLAENEGVPVEGLIRPDKKRGRPKHEGT